ncbi:hypothetical protein HD554DRAFT_2142988 [Boletus coccyginus]|nr:hypothetical protein HD554DRAFT_2142988 [Boletus coccyginus]
MGTMVSLPFRPSFDLESMMPPSPPNRIVNAELRQPKLDRDRHEFSATLAATLTKALHVMLTYTSSEKGRTAVPLITNATGISPFPVQIMVKVDGVEVG